MGILILLLTSLVLVVVLGTFVLVHQMLHPSRKTFGVAVARRLPTDPAGLGLEFIERTFELPDGSATLGWDIRGGLEAGPDVIFTHGWGDSRFGALTWVGLAAASAHRIVVYDLRGHGDSPAPISRLGTAEVWDLLAIVDQLDGEVAADRVVARPLVLWGHSLGAGIAIAAAALDARHETGCVSGVIADGASRVLGEPMAALLRLRRLPSFPFVAMAQLCLGAVIGGTVRGYDRMRHAAQMQCPLLMLHGAADPLASVRAARQIAEAAPRARMEIFENAHHGDLMEVDEARYRSLVNSFLSDVGAEASWTGLPQEAAT